MPPNSDTSNPQPSRRRDTVERLTVYWLATAAVALVVVVAVIVYATGALRAAEKRVQALQLRVAELEQPPGQRPAPTIRPEPQRPAPPVPVRVPVTPATNPAAPPRTAVPPSAPAPTAPPAEAELCARLDVLATNAPATPADVLDQAGATELLDQVQQQASVVRYSGPTWARLAILAQLLDRTRDAEAFAQRAAAAGDTLLTYSATLVRSLLARGHNEQALPAAEDLASRAPQSETARVLLAAALLAADRLMDADSLLARPVALTSLLPYDRLLLARTLMKLDRWDDFDRAVAGLQPVSASLALERNFLEAVGHARGDDGAQALALLDYLAAHLPEPLPAAEPDAPAVWSAPLPERYEVAAWRGVALLFARQTEAAREALLAAAQLDVSRPEAFYYLGLLEARAGQPASAKSHLENAVARSARCVPAWEALAALALDARDVNAALEHINRAIELNPRRASAHFLAAIALAKVSDRDSAAQALRAAFDLDPSYVLKARETDVLLRLFTPAELEELATAPGPESAPAPP